MAKKKEDASKGPVYTADNVDQLLKKQFGDDIFVSGDSIIEKPKTVISISPALDMITGGIPEGSFCVITGPEKVGKTTMCLTFAANAQQEDCKCDITDKPRDVYFYNVEGRLKARDLKGIPGLQTNEPRFNVIESKPGRILHAEDYLEIFQAYVQTKPGSIHIIDSISQLCSEARSTNKVGKRFRDDVPLMLADMTKRVANILPVNNCVVMAITHIIADQNPATRKASMEASGKKIQYQADVKLWATHFTLHPNEDDVTGQIVHWKCTSSALGPPHGKCDSLLRYGSGLDKAWELINYGKDIGLLEVSGSWLAFPNGTKVQGKDKAAQYLRDNPKIYEDMLTQFRELLGITDTA